MKSSSFITSLTLVFTVNLVIQPSIWTEPELPTIEPEYIISELTHSASLLQSGKGKVRIYAEDYFKDKLESGVKNRAAFERVINLLFAFSDQKTYTRSLAGRSKGFERISNGRLTLGRSGIEQSFITVEHGYTIPYGTDPRDWGLWYQRQWLSDYLKKQKDIQVIGHDNLNNIPCFVVETPNPEVSDTMIKFWIAPSESFRCVKIQHETNSIRNGKAIRTIYDTTIEYQKYSIDADNTAWFPKRGITLRKRKSDGKHLGKFMMEVSDFELDVDVSDLFDIQIHPDALVWDLAKRKQIPFKEVGWDEN